MSLVVIERGNFAAANIAKKHGCRPFWWEPYEAFCCGCDDGLHHGDQQCSIITSESALRTRERHTRGSH